MFNNYSHNKNASINKYKINEGKTMDKNKTMNEGKTIDENKKINEGKTINKITKFNLLDYYHIYFSTF